MFPYEKNKNLENLENQENQKEKNVPKWKKTRT